MQKLFNSEKFWLPIGAVLAVVVAVFGAFAGGAGAAVFAAKVGSIEIINPYMTKPATPTIAAIYMTIKNTGSTSDALLGASTPVAQSATLHQEVAVGNSQIMVALPRLEILGHKQEMLMPGYDHLMLQGVRQGFSVGEKVPISLYFQKAGRVSVEVPVVSLLSAANSMSSMDMGN